MKKLAGFKPYKVFEYFEEISAIPRGSGNMDRISNYCVDFAKAHCLKFEQDEAKNVIIFKEASLGYENAEPIILQGHLDMVCQKTEETDIDFEKDGLDIYAEEDYVKAKGTTLGADNGIAVAMILAILDSDDVKHPPIEAVFTTDEEIGMVGAGKLSFANLKGKRMINIDSESMGTVTVSCAGGSDFKMFIPVKRKSAEGRKIKLSVKGLRGGHSGVEINSGRVNANILAARILNHLKEKADFDIISLNGGDKGNAIPVCCIAEILTDDADLIVSEINSYAKIIKDEIKMRESGFMIETEISDKADFNIIASPLKEKLIFLLLCAPNGVIEMSAEIENLVETSLNLGILKTDDEQITVSFALRSNKESALRFLEEKLKTYSECIECRADSSGHYPPWEYKENSFLQDIYKKVYFEKMGTYPKIEAIHAGLECGIFSSHIRGLDCISIGPDMYGIHTVGERLSISSVKKIYDIILNVLEKCK